MRGGKEVKENRYAPPSSQQVRCARFVAMVTQSRIASEGGEGSCLHQGHGDRTKAEHEDVMNSNKVIYEKKKILCLEAPFTLHNKEINDCRHI